MAANPKARVLAEALPYIRAYHGKMLVIRFGGHAMADAALKAGFARDVALLHSVGMKPSVVHGGGVRVTDERTLTIIEMALDELNQELTGLINTRGGRAVGLNGQDGRFIHARQKTLPPDEAGDEAPDLGFVGDIESIDTDLIYLLLSQNFIPVIMPIGVGVDGAAYHINYDLLAGRLARALEAEKLILMT